MLTLKSKKPPHHISAFFIEIILVLLFFCISMSVLISVFAKSFNQNAQADRINSAVMTSSSFCELFSSEGDTDKCIDTLFQNMTKESQDNTIILRDTQSDKITKALITTSEIVSDAGTLKKAHLMLYYKDTLVSETNSSFYEKKGGSR